MRQLRATVRRKGKSPDLIGLSTGFPLAFCLPDPRHLRARVNDAWNDVVIDLAGPSREFFHAGNAFVLGFVRQHRASGHIASRPHARNVRLECSSRDKSAGVGPKAYFLKAEGSSKRPASNCNKDDVRLDCRCLVRSSASYAYQHRIARDAGLDHLGAEAKLETLLFEQALQSGRHRFVGAGRDPIKIFDHLDLRSQTTPNRSKFKANASASNHEEPTRNLSKRKCAGGI